MHVADVGVKCPDCGIKFNSKRVPILIDTGLRNSELRHDFRGVIPQIEQFAVVTCPGCGKADWSNSFIEIDEATVLSQSGTTPHLQFRAAAIAAERQGRDFYNVGLLYLHAAWCADDAKALPQSKEYRRLAIDAYRKSLVDASCPVDKRPEIEYLIGEMLRRAGEFEAAKLHFKQIVPRLSSRLAIMSRKLMRLIDLKDSQPVQFERGEI